MLLYIHNVLHVSCTCTLYSKLMYLCGIAALPGDVAGRVGPEERPVRCADALHLWLPAPRQDVTAPAGPRRHRTAPCIAQRMRLEQMQLDGVQKRMQVRNLRETHQLVHYIKTIFSNFYYLYNIYRIACRYGKYVKPGSHYLVHYVKTVMLNTIG